MEGSEVWSDWQVWAAEQVVGDGAVHPPIPAGSDPTSAAAAAVAGEWPAHFEKLRVTRRAALGVEPNQ